MKNKTKKVVFLCSAGGSTMKFLHRVSRAGVSGYEVVAVISDRDSASLLYAKKNGLPAHRIEYSAKKPKELRDLLALYRPDVIVTNFYRLLDPGTVRLYSGKLVNLHYSLLPSFKGFQAVRTALAMGCKFVGTTVHLVNDEVDGGRMISQCVVPVNKKTPDARLMDDIFRAGCLNLLNSLDELDRSGGYGKTPATVVLIGGRPVVFSPGLRISPERFDARFWSAIRRDSR